MPPHTKRDPATDKHWRTVIEGWQTSGLSGSEYCLQQGLKYTQFAGWKKRFVGKDAESAGREKRPARKSVRLSAKRRGRKAKPAARTASVNRNPLDFVPVKLADAPHQEFADRSVNLEIVLGSGTVIRLKNDCSLEFLSSVITVLENR